MMANGRGSNFKGELLVDWSKTKTVFILAFLTLDLFLGYQLFEKNKSKFEFIAESSVEQKLKAEDITYVDIPNEEIRESYITGRKKHFTKDDFTKLSNQNVSFLTENQILSILEDPIFMDRENLELNMRAFLSQYVVSGDQYSYWARDDETNRLIFFQTFNGKPIYLYEHGMLLIQLNEYDEIIGYEQTLLEDMEVIQDHSNTSIIYAEKALETLYNKNVLKSSNHVSKIGLGYYNIVPVSGDVQFFAPTWHVVINGENDHFINAIDGQIMESETWSGF